MKRHAITVLLFSAFLLMMFTACGGGNNNENGSTAEAVQDLTGVPFSHSEAMDDNGYWLNVRALDYITLFEYNPMPIPESVHYVSDFEIENEIENIISYFAPEVPIYDREVAHGDLVNIDYVGSVDGVPFAGGDTGGMGATVTAGSTEYIDDFLTQIIGHRPGDTVNVEVTFPVDYHAEDLAGRDALFVTVINHIAGDAEINDDFVNEHLNEYYGWTNTAEMRDEIKNNIAESGIRQYIENQIANETEVKSIPPFIMQYQLRSMLAYYEGYAEEYELELDEFLATFVGFDSVDELIAENQENMEASARFYLVVQAVAEDAGITVNEMGVANYFIENMGTSDYSSFEEQYGLPYLKQVVLVQTVLDFLTDNAKLL